MLLYRDVIYALYLVDLEGIFLLVFLTAAGIICSSSLLDGPVKCRLVHITTFPSKVQNCGPWQLLEQVLEQFPAFTADRWLFCLVRSLLTVAKG